MSINRQADQPIGRDFTAYPEDIVKELVHRRAAQESLMAFATYMMPKYVPSKCHFLIAEWLEKAERGEADRVMLLLPPRHGKSTLADVLFPAWYIGRHPENEIITATYGGDLARGFGRKVRNLIDSPEYRRIFPGVGLARDSNSSDRFNTSHEGAYVATGIGGAITGRGAHLGLIDDVHKDRKEADSITMRDRVWDWYTDTFYTRLMDGRSAVVLMMTRWHIDDLAGRLLDAMEAKGEDVDQWEVIDLPAVAEGGDRMGRKPGEALWPERYPIERLRRIQGNISEQGWLSEYQQRPMKEGGNLVKREWLKHWVTVPSDFDEIIQSWDLRFTSKTDSGAYVVGQVWARKGLDRYLLDQIRERADFVRSLGMFRELSKKWPKARVKLVEDKANGPALENVLRNEIEGIILEPPDGDKVARMNACLPEMASGHVYVPPESIPFVRKYVERMVQFPKSDFLDEQDCTSQALNYFQSKTNLLDTLSKW